MLLASLVLGLASSLPPGPAPALAAGLAARRSSGLAATLGPGGKPQDGAPRAPDGRRGFGGGATARDLERMFRSGAPEDVQFLESLASTASKVRVLVAALGEDYRRAGYFRLGGDPRADLTALHAAARAALDRPLETLRSDPGEAFARLALDVRFRVRMRFLEGWEVEAEEVREGLAVVGGLVAGYVVLSDEEAGLIGKRLDLAGSRLRALHNDLTALRPIGAAGVDVSEDEARELVELARGGDGAAWRASWEETAARVARDVDAMARALFTTRLDATVGTELEWRDRARAQAAALRAEAEVLLPHTPAGQAAPDEIRELPKHRRIELAMYRARAGLGLDPLDEELAYVAAWASDYLWGSLESRPLYDRFLALRGIRVHDHRTLRGRVLTSREEQAIVVVQRDLTPGGTPPR